MVYDYGKRFEDFRKDGHIQKYLKNRINFLSNKFKKIKEDYERREKNENTNTPEMEKIFEMVPSMKNDEKEKLSHTFSESQSLRS